VIACLGGSRIVHIRVAFVANATHARRLPLAPPTRSPKPKKKKTASELLRRSLAAVADDPAVFEAYLHVRVRAAAVGQEFKDELEGAPGGGQGAGGAAGGTETEATAGGADADADAAADDEEQQQAAVRRWYAARGFAPAGVVEGYYARLPPPCDALVMRRALGDGGGGLG